METKIKARDIERINETFDILQKNPEKSQLVYEGLEIYKLNKCISSKYISNWEYILKNESFEKIRQMMLENNENGNILRSTSIFFKINESNRHSLSYY